MITWYVIGVLQTNKYDVYPYCPTRDEAEAYAKKQVSDQYWKSAVVAPIVSEIKPSADVVRGSGVVVGGALP